MMEYVLEGRKFSFDYRELVESYTNFTLMTDEEFIKNLPSAIHLACFICFVKQVPSYVCLSDIGIVHELAHLLDIPGDMNLREVRLLFNEQLKLVY